MTTSFERQVKSYKLWTWLYGQLLVNENVTQSDIIEFGEKNNLGSKKSILSFLSEFIDSNLIQELELNTTSVGRPKKAYMKVIDKEIDNVILNLAELPPQVLDFINSESQAEKLLPTEIIIKLLSWAYTMLNSGQYDNNKPLIDLPNHLKHSSDPIERLINN